MANMAQPIATIGDYDVMEMTISETYSNSAANREAKRANDARRSSKGNPALFVTLAVRPRKVTAHDPSCKGMTFSGVSNIVVPL